MHNIYFQYTGCYIKNSDGLACITPLFVFMEKMKSKIALVLRYVLYQYSFCMYIEALLRCKVM